MALFIVPDEGAATVRFSEFTLSQHPRKDIITMTAPHIVDPAGLSGEVLSEASLDLMRTLPQAMINARLFTDAEAVVGAEWGRPSLDRAAQGNGYRDLDTRVGTIDVAVPTLRAGRYSPSVAVRAAQTGRVCPHHGRGRLLPGRGLDPPDGLAGEDPGHQLPVEVPGLPPAGDLDEHVESYRHRSLRDSPAVHLRRRRRSDHEGPRGRARGDGGRAIGHWGQRGRAPRDPGQHGATAETGSAWNEFFADLVARGLAGVRLLTSDAHAGLNDAIAANLPGASRQRCRTHYAANLMAVWPKSMWPAVKAMLHSVYDQPDATAVSAQFDRLLDCVSEKLPQVAEQLEAARADLLAFTAYPKDVWIQIWSTNPAERLNKEIRRGTHAVGILPNGEAIVCLVGAVLSKQTDEWTEGRRYLGLEVLSRCRLTTVADT